MQRSHQILILSTSPAPNVIKISITTLQRNYGIPKQTAAPNPHWPPRKSGKKRKKGRSSLSNKGGTPGDLGDPGGSRDVIKGPHMDPSVMQWARVIPSSDIRSANWSCYLPPYGWSDHGNEKINKNKILIYIFLIFDMMTIILILKNSSRKVFNYSPLFSNSTKRLLLPSLILSKPI